MPRCFLCLASALILLCGCTGPGQASTRRTEEQVSAPAPYVRITNTDSNRVGLQIAARKFVPARHAGPAVWLTGVSHIGDIRYYAALQHQLDAQTLVLFEGIGAAEGEETETRSTSQETTGAKSGPAPASENRGSLQSAMAASLGLVFQLEAIDYHRQSFRNSDLSITQLRQLMNQQEKGSQPSGAGESFENLLQLMDGSSWLDGLLQFALRLLGSNPKFQALGRLALIDLLGEIQGDPSRLQGLPPDMKQLLEVLLQRRNEKVMRDLKVRLPQVGRQGSVAVFFGTGHMPDMETRLRRELDYRPAQEVWFTAFDVNLATAQVSGSERQFIDDFVKWQLNQAGESKPSGAAQPKSQ